MGSKATSDYRRRRKDNLVKACGNKCALCGYSKINAALEFHHLNPQEKSYGVASDGICRDLETDILEIRKCILLCANCHREVHNNCYTQEELKEKQFFDENFINILRQEKSILYEKKKYFCKKCKKEITYYSKSGLCVECSCIQKRKVDRPSREVLKELIRTTPFIRIAEQYGVSDKAISKWCIVYNLPHRKKDIAKITDDQWAKV